MTSVPHHYDTTPLAHTDILVLDYLAALWGAGEDLAPDLRDELMTTVADYIAMRRTAAAGPLDDPRHILQRLGSPEALVAAARRGRMPAHLRRPTTPAPLPPVAAAPSGHLEYAGIALLTAGAVMLPVISPLAGLLLVSGSPRWSPAQKTAAWVLAGLPALLGCVLVLAAFAVGGSEMLVVAYLAMVAGAVIAGLSLLPGLAARRHY